MHVCVCMSICLHRVYIYIHIIVRMSMHICCKQEGIMMNDLYLSLSPLVGRGRTTQYPNHVVLVLFRFGVAMEWSLTVSLKSLLLQLVLPELAYTL